MIMNYEDFESYYLKNKRFPDNQYSNTGKLLNKRQIETKYKKYVSRQEKKFEKKEPSEYMQRVYDAEKNVLDNDPSFNEFWSIWNENEKATIYVKSQMFKDAEGKVIYDPMHCFPRGSNKDLADEELNILYGPRYFHSLLDQYLNPFTEKIMSREEHIALWKRMLGEERYTALEYLAKNKGRDEEEE
jgi:hypothetical protein